MKMWKTATLLHSLAVLVVLASDCDPVFGYDEASASSSASEFVGQDNVTEVLKGGVNSTSLFITSLVASPNMTRDATEQPSVVTVASSSSDRVTKTQTTSTSSNSESTSLLKATKAAMTSSVAFASDTTSTTTSLLPNWVGTGGPSDNACYRKTYISRTCSKGYAFDNIATCWAQCPLNYPVQCGMECIPQNDDCTLEVIKKVESVAKAAINVATSGVFGQLSAASGAVQQGVKCGQQLFLVVDKIVKYNAELLARFPNSTETQIISLLKNSDIVVKDLPTAVAVCLGLDVPTDLLNLASSIVKVVNQVLIQVVEKGSSLISVDTFKAFISAIGAGKSVESLGEDDTLTLEKLIAKGKTCGTELQSILAKVAQSVADIKTANVTASISAIRLAMDETALFLTEIPTVTNNCIKDITGDPLAVRDKIRKALSVITDNLINSSNDESGNALSKADYILKVADMGLDVIAMFDPTGIAAMLEEFIQPICGPTAFIGEIDDGSLADALALVAHGKAFSGSSGTWTHSGDGAVNIVFESTDTEDVTVMIHSGGVTIDQVKVKRGETITWKSTVAALQDKTMYFDRWRPGLIGLAGSGGGSLVLWVPRSSEGGHMDLVAKINVS